MPNDNSEINPKILEKITQKTCNDSTLRDLLNELIDFEFRKPGRYSEEYKTIIENFTRGE